MYDYIPETDSQSHFEFSAGGILGKSFSILLRNFGQFLIIGTITFLPALFWLLKVARDRSIGETWVAVLFLGVTVFSVSMCQGMLMFAAFQQLRRRPVHAFESIKHGISVFMPVLMVSVLATVLIMLGLCLLLIPGIIAATAFAIAVPVCVLEKCSPVQSLYRSAELTRGYRWSIFGAFLVIRIVDKVAEYLINVAFLPYGSVFGFVAATYVLLVLVSVFQTIIALVTFHELKVRKEGVDIDKIAAVFD